VTATGAAHVVVIGSCVFNGTLQSGPTNPGKHLHTGTSPVVTGDIWV